MDTRGRIQRLRDPQQYRQLPGSSHHPKQSDKVLSKRVQWGLQSKLCDAIHVGPKLMEAGEPRRRRRSYS